MAAMEGSRNMELADSILSTAASMQVLADELDRISIHSNSGLHSPSRDSLQSSSKYDSAFDSHFSEDTASLSSQVVSVSYPIDIGTSILPSILTPPTPYRVADEEDVDNSRRQPVAPSRDRCKKKRKQATKSKSPKITNSNPSLSPLVTYQLGAEDENSPSPHLREGGHFPSPHLMENSPSPPSHQLKEGGSPISAHHQGQGLSQVVGQHLNPLSSATHPHRTVSHLMSRTTLPTLCQPQCVYVEPKEESIVQISSTNVFSETTPIVSSRSPTKQLAETSFPTHQRHPSESSSTEDDLISNDSIPTPTAERRQLPQSQQHTAEEVDTQGLSPRVTIIYPNPATDTDYSDDSPLVSRHNYFPKTGTLFYQERLTPQPSPLHAARQHNVSHTLPSRYRDSALNPQPNAKLVKRSGSILQRLKRKRGSFKEDGKLKRKLPVKRSMSERMTYHIKKGWVDYAEELDFISQPSHPRAVGRMIDKKAGKYHVIQLYKPSSGRYGIYISQRGNKGGVFISRFATDTAEKFYSGLINPGDQVIRVNGKNIGRHHSVDDVYDMMTGTDSVIFTVIPVNSRSDW